MIITRLTVFYEYILSRAENGEKRALGLADDE